MVAFGTLLSSFWILATNSWMQTPQGYKMVDGRFEPVDWVAIIFNPSFPYRLTHNVTAFYITTAFVVLGVAAWLLRRARAAGGMGIYPVIWDMVRSGTRRKGIYFSPVFLHYETKS